jgi:hypothetical protein
MVDHNVVREPLPRQWRSSRQFALRAAGPAF